MSDKKGGVGCRRCWYDVWFVIWFAVYPVTVLISDYFNFQGAMHQVDVHELGNYEMWPWHPPKQLLQLYLHWCDAADPLLCANPPYFQTMEAINILFLLWFSVVQLFGFIGGWNSIRKLGLVWAACCFYSVVVCCGETFLGASKSHSPNPMWYLAMYIPYAIFPLLLFWRLWNDKPFSASGLPSTFGGLLMSLIGVATLAQFGFFMYQFIAKHGVMVFPELAEFLI